MANKARAGKRKKEKGREGKKRRREEKEKRGEGRRKRKGREEKEGGEKREGKERRRGEGGERKREERRRGGKRKRILLALAPARGGGCLRSSAAGSGSAQSATGECCACGWAPRRDFFLRCRCAAPKTRAFFDLASFWFIPIRRRHGKKSDATGVAYAYVFGVGFPAGTGSEKS